MDSLIEKLEKATEGSRELDGLIFRAVRTDAPDRDWCDFEGVWFLRDPDDDIAWEAPPAYTTSLDVALALIPSRCDCVRFVDDPSGTGWELGEFTAGEYRKLGDGVTAGQRALALCIATLKALKETGR